MAMKRGRKYVSFVVFGPDGNLYSVLPGSQKPMKKLQGCEEALNALRKCLDSQSDIPVLSGVMMRSNGKPASRKRVARQSAKKSS